MREKRTCSKREKGNKQQQFEESKEREKCLNNLHVNHDLFVFTHMIYFIYSFFTKNVL